MNSSNQKEEDNNPFPEDGSYQSKEAKVAKFSFAEYGKIPLKIYGGRRFNLLADAGEGIGNYLPYDEKCTLEEGIGMVIRRCIHNAKVHLKLVQEKRNEPTGIEGLAAKIVNYGGRTEDLFCLVYLKSRKRQIERQLGKYSNLEKRVVNSK